MAGLGGRIRRGLSCVGLRGEGLEPRQMLAKMGFFEGADFGGLYEEAPAGNADGVGVYNPGAGEVYLTDQLTTGHPWLQYQYGAPESQAVVGDWNGDGFDSVGVFEPGSFMFRLKNQNHNQVFSDEPLVIAFGAPGFVAIGGDWDGDGVDTIGVYDPASSNFFLRNSNTSGPADAGQFVYGGRGWVPLVGDWDGDGRDGIGVYNPEKAIFYLRNTLTAGEPEVAPFHFGMPGWRPIAGDWNDDGMVTVGAYNPETATFFLRNSNTTGEADVEPFNYGGPGWDPIVGNWDYDDARFTESFYLDRYGISFRTYVTTRLQMEHPTKPQNYDPPVIRGLHGFINTTALEDTYVEDPVLELLDEEWSSLEPWELEKLAEALQAEFSKDLFPNQKLPDFFKTFPDKLLPKG